MAGCLDYVTSLCVGTAAGDCPGRPREHSSEVVSVSFAAGPIQPYRHELFGLPIGGQRSRG